MKRKLTATLTCVLALALAGCAGQEGQGGSSAGGAKDSIVIALGDKSASQTFDPIQADIDRPDFFHSTLVTFDQDLKIANDLATDYKISDDNKTYTFTIRDDAKFADGTQLTAKDVVFTFEKAKEIGTKIDLSRMDSVTAPDDHTVVFQLSEAYSPFLGDLTHLGIVPSADYGPDYGSKPNGSGKYKLAQLDKDQQVVLEPNEYYYGDKPKIKKITIRALSDDVVLPALRSGELDLANVPATLADQDIPGFKVVESKSNATMFIHLPYTPEHTLPDGKVVGNNVTSDAAIRQALNIGINRDEVAQNVLNGFGDPSYQLIGRMDWSNSEPSFTDSQVDEANAMLDKAGWVDSDGDGIREKNGQKAEFKINGSSNETQRYNVAVAVSQQAKAMGIQIDVVSASWSDCRKESGTTPTVWEAGSYQPVDVDYYGQSDLGGVSYYNPSYYSNEKVDGYVHQALEAAPDDAEQYWKQAQYDGTTGINSDVPYLPVIFQNDVYYVRDGLNIGTQRMHSHGMGGSSMTYNMDTWTFSA